MKNAEDDWLAQQARKIAEGFNSKAVIILRIDANEIVAGGYCEDAHFSIDLTPWLELLRDAV
jgi:hypothetical protein